MTNVDHEFSRALRKVRGVPQGSCLGPILFNLYTADITTVVKHCNVHLYADDSQLHFSYDKNSLKNAIGAINDDLNSVAEWSMSHGLKLNSDKCSVLHVAPPMIRQALKAGEGGFIQINDQKLKINDKV